MRRLGVAGTAAVTEAALCYTIVAAARHCTLARCDAQDKHPPRLQAQQFSCCLWSWSWSYSGKARLGALLVKAMGVLDMTAGTSGTVCEALNWTLYRAVE